MDNMNYRELAEKVYELDERVYEELGSSLGRVFSGSREKCIRDIQSWLEDTTETKSIRRNLALISNMARTIRDKDVRREIMGTYDEIVQQVIQNVRDHGTKDILDPKIADLTQQSPVPRFQKDDHLIICLSRAYGSAGNKVGFRLAESLHLNFYDMPVLNEIFRRQEQDVPEEASAYSRQEKSFVDKVREFIQYHGLSKTEVQFFETSKFLVERAKSEDFVVMGRYADAILTMNHIPHVSIFLTAPEKRRVKRIMNSRPELSYAKAKKLVQRVDRDHLRRYVFFTGRSWSQASNYDLCLNTAAYGIDGSVDMILRTLDMHKRG